MGEIRRELRERKMPIYRVAKAVGISIDRLYRMLAGRSKDLLDREVSSIAAFLGWNEERVRADLRSQFTKQLEREAA